MVVVEYTNYYCKSNKDIMPTKVVARIINWLIYSVFFTILPLLLSIIIKFALNKLHNLNDLSNSTELIFFAVFIGASGSADMENYSKKLSTKYEVSTIVLRPLLSVGSICSACIYAFILQSTIQSENKLLITNTINNNFLPTMFYAQIILAIFMIIPSIFLQFMIGIIEEEDCKKLEKELQN